jgi:hypothetical protein
MQPIAGGDRAEREACYITPLNSDRDRSEGGKGGCDGQVAAQLANPACPGSWHISHNLHVCIRAPGAVRHLAAAVQQHTTATALDGLEAPHYQLQLNCQEAVAYEHLGVSGTGPAWICHPIALPLSRAQRPQRAAT